MDQRPRPNIVMDIESLVEERILDRRGRGRSVSFLVKFKNHSHPRWIPKSEVRSMELVEQYERRRNRVSRQEARARGQAREMFASLNDPLKLRHQERPTSADTINNQPINQEPSRQEEVCTVCYNNQATMAFIPCGHLVSCASCVAQLEKMCQDSDSRLACPLCRTFSSGTLRIFTA